MKAKGNKLRTCARAGGRAGTFGEEGDEGEEDDSRKAHKDAREGCKLARVQGHGGNEAVEKYQESVGVLWMDFLLQHRGGSPGAKQG